ncbi:peptide MFS transporter [Chryseobacterium wangxinyae]|uniref:peptide MFS transporter n=1 Tax=Chryseobacterium sp. CY350 TaxID=2997336 RepID=UPI00226DD9FF|nr:peptide MFS transporter [Chryseobacterium sp. CY350]MCY0977927.1 peptide MFS transporter [Chryseobacterium sp. CY350]WBZ95015.1 peptide MFS transporter [Chryseobacterium sp. CY350]
MDTVVQSQTKHPKGLWVLFGTEMWERFNFYGMRALLTLFMVNSLLMKEGDVTIIYGGFLALCYLTPMLGGFIADRFLGNRYCIIVGGALMALGQFLMFMSASTFGSNLGSAQTLMWIALGVIIFGNGFFKPNISSMVGSLYPKQEKSKLDSAFTIFYMGINLGAFLGQFICPFLGDVKDSNGLRDIHAFKWGFLAASIAMTIGTLTFILLKNKYVITPEGRPIGGLPSESTAEDFEEGESQTAKFSGKSIGIAVVVFLVTFFGFQYLFVSKVGFGSVGMGEFVKAVIYPFIYSMGLALAYLIMSATENKIERDRIWVIYIVSFFIIFFWAAFEQAGSSLTFIADNQTDRHILGWNMPPSMVQIFNGLFIVVLAVPFSMLWDKLRANKKEPVSPLKQAIGLGLIALSYLIIAYNVKDLGNTGLLAVKWLILLYLIQTMGELCLSPIGLSLVGKLAPKRFASLLFGVFFIANAAGYALSGTLGSILPATGDKFLKAKELGINLQDVLDKKVTLSADQISLLDKEQISTVYNSFAGFEIHNLFEFFMVFVILCGIAGAILALISPILKKMMHGVN